MNKELPVGCWGMPLHLVNQPCIFGCDVRPASWSVCLADTVVGGHGKRVIRPCFYGDLRSESEVLFILRQYGARFGIVDSRPEATLAIRLQEDAQQYGIQVWRSQYNTAPSEIKILRNESQKLLTLERTITLDTVHHAFKTGLGVVLPQNVGDMKRFIQEMTSSTRVFVKSNRREYYTWEHAGADHAFHAFNLLMVAFELSGLSNWMMGETIMENGIVESSLDRNLVDPIPGRRRIFGAENEKVYLEA